MNLIWSSCKAMYRSPKFDSMFRRNHCEVYGLSKKNSCQAQQATSLASPSNIVVQLKPLSYEVWNWNLLKCLAEHTVAVNAVPHAEFCWLFVLNPSMRTLFGKENCIQAFGFLPGVLAQVPAKVKILATFQFTLFTFQWLEEAVRVAPWTGCHFARPKQTKADSLAGRI